jgi:hypothetical protein
MEHRRLEKGGGERGRPRCLSAHIAVLWWKRHAKRTQGALFPLAADTAVVWLDDTGDENPGRIRPFPSTSALAAIILSQEATDTHGPCYSYT